MYFNQLAMPTANHLSKNQHQTIPKTRQQQIHTNTKKKKKMPNPPLNINLRLPGQIIKERIKEKKNPKLKNSDGDAWVQEWRHEDRRVS